MRISVLVWLLHAYVAWRIGADLPSAWAGIAFAALLVGSALVLPYGFVHRRASARETPRLRIAALVVLGFVSTLFVLTLLRDVALGAAWAIDAALGASLPLAAIATWSAVAVPLLAVLASAVGFANVRQTARIVRVDVPVDGLHASLDGFTVAQISDVHVGPTIRKPEVEAIVAAVNGLDADMVAITGDLVDGSVAELGPHVAPLAGLQSRSGTFFVTGNHEYYSGAARWIVALGGLGIRVLLNEHVTLVRGDARVVVAGVTDVSAGHFDRTHASDPERALAGSPRDAFRILLAHQPKSAAAAERAGADLQLSGHTHGGQFWPWNHFVRLQQPFTAGLARLGRMWVYTSRGTGYWGPPKRVGAPSEITLLRLVPAGR